jgi:zinc protease
LLLNDRAMAWEADVDAKVQALTADQVTAAFRRNIDPRKLTIVKAGSFAKVTQAGRPAADSAKP